MSRRALLWITAAGLASLTSCAQSPVAKDGKTLSSAVKIVEYDGCEYLVFESSEPGFRDYTFAITHKGNCANPIHKH